MELVWSDEFDGDAIDRSNWTYDIGGWGWGNGEAQYYTDRPENARTQNGLLVIELRAGAVRGLVLHLGSAQDPGPAGVPVRPDRGAHQGAERERHLAGVLDAGGGLRAATSDDPSKQWPNIGEIDIMEYVGREPDLVIGTIHGPGYAGAGGRSKWNRQEFDIGDDFHTFAIDWDAEGIRWFFDDEMYFEIGPEDLGDREWVFDQPFFFILNLALGGTLGGNDRARSRVPDPVLRRLRPRLPARPPTGATDDRRNDDGGIVIERPRDQRTRGVRRRAVVHGCRRRPDGSVSDESGQ